MLFTVLLVLFSSPVSPELEDVFALVASNVTRLATKASFPSKSGRVSVTRLEAASAVVLFLSAMRWKILHWKRLCLQFGPWT